MLIERAEIISVIRAFNPWWAGRPAPAPPFKRIAFLECLRFLEDAELRRAILLSGPRRVGKTTILYQIAERAIRRGARPRSILFLSLDHPVLKLVRLGQVLELYHQEVHPHGEPALLLLDEVQYASDWELEIKHLVDHRPSLRIVATGSAALSHRKRLAESGAGRWVTVSIPTLSFYEFVNLRQEHVPDLPETLAPIHLFSLAPSDLAELGELFRPLLPLFSHYLLVGGFPETAKRSDVDLCQRLLREDVVERVLKRDMTALFGIRSVNDLEKLFLYICLHTGGILGVQTCAKELGVSSSTVATHLDALEQSNLIYRLPPTGLGGKALLKARHKIYLVDAALRNAVLMRGSEILNDPIEMGVIAETTILRHFKAFHHRDAPRMSYWRDPRSDKEVDIIVEWPTRAVPIEVKYRDPAQLTPREGLLAFCERARIEQAYFVTKRELDFDVSTLAGTKVLRVPAHVLTYLLGQAEQQMWQVERGLA